MGSAPLPRRRLRPFYNYAAVKIKYAIDRYTMEVKRQLDVLDRQLAEHKFIAGDDYTIADMAIWPWYGSLVLDRVYEAAEFLKAHKYENVVRRAKTINERPAVKRGRMVNSVFGEPENQLRDRHEPSNFEHRTWDKVGAEN